MGLQIHIRQEFPGDTAQFAFEILTVLHEYYERTNQLHSLYNILNYDTKALEIFNLRKDGDVDIKEKVHQIANSDWISVQDNQFPSISFKYKLDEGTSCLKGSMVVNASVDRVLNTLISLDERRKWDLFYDGGRVLNVISDTEFIDLVMMNYEFGKLCFTLRCKIERFGSSAASISAESVVLPDTIMPPGYDVGGNMKRVYNIETSKEPISLFESNLSTSPASSDHEGSDIDVIFSESEVVHSYKTVLNYDLQQANDTSGFTTAALEGRLILLSWSRLKALVENQDIEVSKGSITCDTLQDSVQRKHLKSNLPTSLRSSLSD